MDGKRVSASAGEGLKRGARRGLSLLLALVLVVSLLVGAVFAQPAGKSPLLNDGESIASVAAPSPDSYTVDKGTVIGSIGLPTTLEVVITGGDPSPRTADAAVTWVGTYTPDTEDSYTLTASFTDTTISYGGAMPTVSVTVKANATLLARIAALPSVEEAAAMSEVGKQTLRAKLISIDKALNEMDAADKAAVEAEAGATQMALFDELYGIYASSVGGAKDTLDGDWVYIDKLSINDVKDGTGPFDTESSVDDVNYKNRQGNDETDSNGIVRSFDTVTYGISYVTKMSGEYDNVAAGYMCYEFALPYTVDKAMMDTSAMKWMGTQYTKLSSIPAASSGFVVTTGTRIIDGEEKECQIVTGKRWMTGTDTNPNAFPGSGTVNAVVQVLAMKQNEEVKPQFTFWMDHNTTDGACEGHGRTEPKVLLPDPIKVTAELRINVQLQPVTSAYVNRLGTFDFSTGGDSALNKTDKTIYGRLMCYGVTLQLYNQDANKGLRGCALPEGDITLDIDFATAFVKDKDTKNPVPLAGQTQYTPLVWSYGPNESGDTQVDGREVKAYGSSYATYQAPANGSQTGEFTVLPSIGSSSCWNGGEWGASQSGSKVSLTVKDYVINPTWFPHTNNGNSFATNVYFDRAQGVLSTHIGGFSAGELYMLIPFGGDGSTTHADYLGKKYGAGTVSVTATDTNLHATSEIGEALATVPDNSNQQHLEDDRAVSTCYLSMPGILSNIIRYASDTGKGDINGSTAFADNGQDAAAVGQAFNLTWGTMYNARGEQSNAVYGVDSLLKFDDTAIELTGEPIDYTVKYESGNKDTTATANYLYAAKKDGTGWRGAKDSDGNYALTEAEADAVMNTAVQGDLVYYPTLAALEEDGKVCVGVLREERSSNPVILPRVDAVTTIPCCLKNEYSLAGKVYQICISSTCWTESTYNKAKTAAGGGDGYTIPSRLTVQNTPGASMPVATTQDVRGNYVKAVYDDSGYAGGHTGNHNIGDSLYVTPYKCTITKSVVQKIANTTKPMSTYDLDFDQRVADYALYPGTKTEVDVEGNDTTRVTIVDTLPEGLRYIPDSAWQGGTYEQNDAVGRQGTVTGGTALPPETVVVNDDGTTTITWVLEDVTIGDDIEPIYYSCAIGNKGAIDDVSDGVKLQNIATISATEDHRVPSTDNGNLAKASISVSKQHAASVSKVADSLIYEAGQPMGWTLYCGNNGANDISNAIMLDTLPADGDAAGSSFGATLNVTEWKIDKAAASNTADWSCYYTEDAAAEGLLTTDYLEAYAVEGMEDATEAQKTEAALAALRAAIEGLSTTVDGQEATWKKATIGADGSVADLVGKSPTAVAVIGTLKIRETYMAHITLQAAEDGDSFLGGDKLVNSLSHINDTASATSYVVYRTLEGVTWLDADKNGQRDSAETMLPGITVTLMKLKDGGDATKEADYEVYKVNNDEIKVTSGQQLDLLSGASTPYEDGRYKFTSLPAGTFAVRFSDGTVELAKYTASPDNSGSDYTDSDAVATNDAVNEKELVSGFIGSLVMPALNKMGSYLYESKYNDMGVYLDPPTTATIGLSVTKTLEGDELDADTSFSFTLARTDTGAAAAVTMPEDCTVTTEDITSGSAAAVSFDDITFNQAGVYTFSVTETASGILGMVDAATQSVTVTVTESNHALSATVTTPATGGALTFTNSYTKVDPVDLTLTGNKTLIGEKETTDITEGQFTFKIVSDASNDAEGFSGLTEEANVQAGGAIDFGTLTFNNTGTYKFTITENNLKAENYTYDSSVYVVTVVVTLNRETGKLETKTTQTKSGAAAESITFVNSYGTTVPHDPTESPDTGDYSRTGLYLALGLCALAGLAVVVTAKQKKSKAQ